MKSTVNRRSFLQLIPIFFATLWATACGKAGTAGTPSTGTNWSAVASGVVASLGAALAAFTTLSSSNHPALGAVVPILKQIVATAGLINTDVQAGAFTSASDANLTTLGNLAAQIVPLVAGASPAIIGVTTAISVGISLFESIRAAFHPSTTAAVNPAVEAKKVAANQKKLDGLVSAIQKESAK